MRLIGGVQLKTIILAAFFFSGASALIYEVVWMRMLTLTFGTTVFAVSAVLASFMGGLALGSWFFGRIADKVEDRLRLYIILEIGIGVYGLFTPFLFKFIDLVYSPFAAGTAESFYVLSMVRFSLAFSVMLLGTALMGGTLPVLSKFYVTRVEDAGRGVGALYGLNTAGAVLGAGLCGFALIPVIGVSATLYAAIAANLIIGSVVYLFWRRGPKVTPFHKGRGAHPEDGSGGIKEAAPLLEAGKKTRVKPAQQPAGAKWVPAALAVSGFTALAYEVVWTRVLSLVIGGSVYAFTTMLVTFLLGIALGAFVMSAFIERAAGKKYLLFALFEAGIALSVLLGAAFAGKLPELFLFLAKELPGNFLGIQLMQFTIALLVMLPATLLFGAIFPLACRIYVEKADELGEEVGRLYSANTIGAIAGSFAAGFALVPLLGSESTLKAVAWVNIAVAIAFTVKFSEARKAVKAALVCVVIFSAFLLGVFMPQWNPLLMNSNFPNIPKIVQMKPAIPGEYLKSDVIYVGEDVSGNVLVYRDAKGYTNLTVNGHSEGGNHRNDMPVQVQLAAIPAMIHPSPGKTLVIGLGAGVTLGSLEKMVGVNEIDVVEISGGVVGANRYFSPYNNRALEDKRVRLIIDDARHYLAHTDKTYDLIISGPSYSWVSGAANLFTVEHFRLVRERLNPGGMVAMWFHLYNVTPPDIKIFLRTVSEAFPYATVWLSSSGWELIVVASEKEFAIDGSEVARRFKDPFVNSEIGRVMNPAPESLLGLYFMGNEEVLRYANGALVNSDNNPSLEFGIPKHLYGWDYGENIRSLEKGRIMAVRPEAISP